MPCPGRMCFRSVGWLVGKIKSNIPSVPLSPYPLPTPSSTLCFTPRSYLELAKKHVSADDESVVLFQRMSTPSGFPVITQISYPQAQNFTIKEVPIPEVKDDEVLLKGIVLPLCSGVLGMYIYVDSLLCQSPTVACVGSVSNTSSLRWEHNFDRQRCEPFNTF
jgi:hypothetical protein